MRDKIDERRHFYSHEKKEIILKSRGKCAHCGCVLKTPGDMTVEHIIPIAKGGTNDKNNLAVLCEKCNKDKGEKVLLPSSYLRYFTQKYRVQVDRMFDIYCKQVGYLTSKNFLFSDRIDVEIWLKLWSNSSKGNCLKSYLCKAWYNDLDEIYEFCKEYYTYYSINVDIYDILRSYFDKGAIYYTRSRTGAVDYVMLVSLGSACSEDGIAYNISAMVLPKVGLALSKDFKVIRGGMVKNAYSKDMSCLKFDAILRSFLGGCCRSSEDSNISYGADVVISWYSVDGRLRTFFEENLEDTVQKSRWLENEPPEEGVEEVGFTADDNRNGYSFERAEDWNRYIESIYCMEDEIKLYSVLRDKKYMVQLLFKAKKLREIREKLYRDVDKIS